MVASPYQMGFSEARPRFYNPTTEARLDVLLDFRKVFDISSQCSLSQYQYYGTVTYTWITYPLTYKTKTKYSVSSTSKE